MNRPIKSIRYHALLLTLLVGGIGCRSASPSSRPMEGSPEVVLRSESALRTRFGGELRGLLLAGQYDSLEHIAASLRTNHTRWPNGGWKLRTFYYQGFDEGMDHASDAAWESHLQHLRQWKQAYPQSETAPIALANALIGYAWRARGAGYSKKVSDESFRLMGKRLGEARMVLADARKLPRVCPGWWAAAQRVALGEGWNRKLYEELFSQAVEVEPSFDAYYDLKALHLLPRWYGKEGEWEAYADSVANRLPAPEGDKTYARIVWYIQRYTEENIFQESQASWDRTKRGFEELVKSYPTSLELRSALAYLAWQAADQETARQQLAGLGTQIDPGVWEDRNQFLEARRWAFTP